MTETPDTSGVFSYFPNPVFNGTLRFSQVPEGAELRVWTSEGKLVLEQVLTEPQADVSLLSQGLYYFQIIAADRKISGSFVK